MEDVLDTVMFYDSFFLRCLFVCHDDIVHGDGPEKKIIGWGVCNINVFILFQNFSI